jgi:nucleotide-binding universal stress UspA family protein
VEETAVFQKILVAVDSSDSSQSALRYALDLAKVGGGSILLVNIVDVSKLVAIAGYETPYPLDAIQIMRQNSQELLDNSAKTCAAAGVASTMQADEGDACDQILRIAKEQNADLIALGTHGRQGLSRLFIGSVAEGVLRRSDVPVLVTRE